MPSRVPAVVSQRLLDLRRLVAHSGHQLDQLGLLLLAREGHDLLTGDLGGLGESEDFGELLVEVGEFCHCISEFGVWTG